PGRDGPAFRPDAPGEQGVEGRVGPQGLFRLALVEAGGVFLPEDGPVQPEAQGPGGDADPGQLDAEDGDEEVQQAAVDKPGLAEFLAFDRPGAFIHGVAFGAQSSAVTTAATRRALAMIVRAGPTPREVGRKLPSTTKTLGWSNIRQSGSR